jgi:hypothetical protein
MINFKNFFKSEQKVIEQALKLMRPQNFVLIYFDDIRQEYALLGGSQHYMSDPKLDVKDLAVSHVGYYSNFKDYSTNYEKIAEGLIEGLHEIDCGM